MTILQDGSGSTATAGLTVKTEVHAGLRVAQLYLSADPADNAPLTVNLVNGGDQPLSLTPPDPSGGGTRLSLSFSSNLVAPKDVGSLRVSRAGWTCTPAPPGAFPSIVLTPDTPDAIAPGREVSFLIENLSLRGSPGTGKITIGYHNLGPLVSGALPASVSLDTKPQPGFTCDCARNQIYVTREGETEVANTIEFSIRMSPTAPAVPAIQAPSGPPVFSISFKYGDGYGTLTPVYRSAGTRGRRFQSGGSRSACTRNRAFRVCTVSMRIRR